MPWLGPDLPLVVRERRRWRSVLAPIHLQLLEGLRRVTEGQRGASLLPRVRRAVPDASTLVARASATTAAVPLQPARAAQAGRGATEPRATRWRSATPPPTRSGRREQPMTRRGPHEGSIYQRKDGRWAGSRPHRLRWTASGSASTSSATPAPRSRRSSPRSCSAQRRAAAHPRPARRRSGPFLRTLARRGREADAPRLDVRELRRHRPTLHLIPGLGRIPLAKLTPADVQAFLNRKLGVRPLPSPGPVHPRRPATGPRDRGALGHGEPQRRQARRPAAGPEARDPPADARAGAAAHRGLGRGPATGRSTSPRSAPACGRASCSALRWEDVDLEARRLRVRHTLANVDGTLDAPGAQDRPQPPDSSCCPAVVIEALRAHRTRQKMERLVAGSRWVDSGHVFTTTIGTPHRRGDRHAGPSRPPSTRAGLPDVRFHDLRHAAATFLAGAGLHARGRQEPPRALLDRADVEHLRARARAAAAAGGAGDGRGAGRVR